MKDWRPTGVIMRESPFTEEITALGVPVVLSPLTKEVLPDGVSHILADDAGIGRMGAEHLLDRGFKVFAYCSYNWAWWSRNRCKGFQERVAEAGFETHIHLVKKLKPGHEWHEEQEAMIAWLKSLPKPIGLMTSVDDYSQQVCEACRIADIHVPEEIAIIGVDDDSLICDRSNPALSSVALNTIDIGYQAAELLNTMMNDKEAEPQTLYFRGTHVVTRQSTDIMSIEDSEVVEAIQFIRSNACFRIQVSDVISKVAVSRRSLERRFHQILGRSILGEIQRVKINMSKQLLVDTNLTMSEVAAKTGFSNGDHFTNVFRKLTNTTPLSFRKSFHSGSPRLPSFFDAKSWK